MAARSSALSKEKRALAAVRDYEKKKGRKAERAKQGDGYDFTSGRRKIEVKTIARVKNGFVQLNAKQFSVLCADKDYWVYLVVLDPKPQIFPFPRKDVLPFIRFYVHFDFFYKKRYLARMQRSSR